MCICRHVARQEDANTHVPNSPSLFDYSDEERPNIYIQAYGWANQHADIPINVLQSRENRDTHRRTISTTAVLDNLIGLRVAMV